MNDIMLDAGTVGRLKDIDPYRFAVESYLSGYRGRTQATLRIDLKLWTEWCLQMDATPLLIEPVHLKLYLKYLQARETRRGNVGHPLAEATIARYFGTVLHFYRRTWEDELIPKNPGRGLHVPEIDREKQRRTFLSPLEYAALLLESQRRPNDHAVVAILGMMGLRISELCSLRIENLKTSYGYETLTFTGKGNKTAEVPVPVPVSHAIRKNIFDDARAGWIVHDRAGSGPMSQAAVSRVLRRLAKKVGIDRDITAHGLRRTFITVGLMNGISIRDMQVAARHADPAQTVRYDMMIGSMERHAAHRVAGFLAGMNR